MGADSFTSQVSKGGGYGSGAREGEAELEKAKFQFSGLMALHGERASTIID